MINRAALVFDFYMKVWNFKYSFFFHRLLAEGGFFFFLSKSIGAFEWVLFCVSVWAHAPCGIGSPWFCLVQCQIPWFPAGNLSLFPFLFHCHYLYNQAAEKLLIILHPLVQLGFSAYLCIQIHACMLTQNSGIMLSESLDLFDLQMCNRMHVCV